MLGWGEVDYFRDEGVVEDCCEDGGAVWLYACNEVVEAEVGCSDGLDGRFGY